MSIGLSKMIEDAEQLLDRGRILPALELLKQARSMTKIPVRWLFLTFNIGVVYWDKLGDGLSAKAEFLAAANAQGRELDHPAARVLRANALENLMLSASSFEEFDNFTAKLRALAPEMPVVSGLPPVIHEMRDRASPWSSALFHLAMSNYNRNNPAQDWGRYGVAKSAYHILLATRRQQRLSREDWRLALFEYCALSMRMAADCMRARGGDNDPNPPDEFMPILTDAIPLVDEYLTANTGDDAMRKVRGDLDTMVNNCRERWTALQGRMSPMATRTACQACRKCGTVFARRDINGPDSMTWMTTVLDHTTMCPKCGGDVVWQSSADLETGPGCLPMVLGLVVAVGAALGVLGWWFPR